MSVDRSPTLRLAATTAGTPQDRALSVDRSPAVRLAAGNPGRSDTEIRALAPAVRLADMGGEKIHADVHTRSLGPQKPDVRLAEVAGMQGTNTLAGLKGVERIPVESAPALLVSFFYLDVFLKAQAKYVYRDWVIDSGAYSAFNSGGVIDLTEYIATCKHLLANDPTLVECYSLDVIGDWKKSLANTERMWSEGIEAIPAYHAGEPWEVLELLARDYPKIAFGGVALKRAKAKMAWANQCFARVWPKKIHGFAFGGKAVLELPFHSVDSTSWAMGPLGYGNWKAYPGVRLSWRGSSQNLRAEVEYHLEIERKARWRWRREMALLETL